MIIVVEGPDGVGKTTLATELAQRLNAPYWNRPESPLRGLDVAVSQAMHETEMSLLETLDCDVVIDRFFPSEWAYDKAFQREFDEGAIDALSLRFALARGLMVHLYWPSDVSDEQIDARTDDEVSVDTIRRVGKRYREFFASHTMNQLGLNCLMPKNMMIESVMRQVVRCRPSKDVHYMDLALRAARRSTCLSRRTGAVLVSRKGHVIATGYNGAPAGVVHQQECERLRAATYGSGCSLDGCVDVHAEANAIIQAASQGSGVEGSTMYTVNSPCAHCAKLIINSGVCEVVYDKLYGDVSGVALLERVGIRHREVMRR